MGLSIVRIDPGPREEGIQGGLGGLPAGEVRGLQQQAARRQEQRTSDPGPSRTERRDAWFKPSSTHWRAWSRSRASAIWLLYTLGAMAMKEVYAAFAASF